VPQGRRTEALSGNNVYNELIFGTIHRLSAGCGFYALLDKAYLTLLFYLLFIQRKRL